MEYIKGTNSECEDYNMRVVQGENYQGSTTQWSEVQEIGGFFYVALHPKYPTNLETVNQLPEQTDTNTI